MKVLIIDDEPLVRRSLRRVLEKEGWSIVEAEDGQKGLQAWLTEKPDLVLLDVLMPALSGPQVLENLPLATRNKTRVIMKSEFILWVKIA